MSLVSYTDILINHLNIRHKISTVFLNTFFFVCVHAVQPANQQQVAYNTSPEKSNVYTTTPQHLHVKMLYSL